MQENLLMNFNNQVYSNGLQYAWHGIAGVEYDLGKNIEVNVEATTNIFLNSKLIKINFTRTLPNLIRLMMYSKTLSLNQDNPMELTFFIF